MHFLGQVRLATWPHIGAVHIPTAILSYSELCAAAGFSGATALHWLLWCLISVALGFAVLGYDGSGSLALCRPFFIPRLAMRRLGSVLMLQIHHMDACQDASA
jgi:hypothetical protein